MKTFIIIPCYNDAAFLERVINSVKPYGQVVVVDDGSTDNSREIAQSAQAIVLKHRLNRGQGAALETGDLYALREGAEIVVHFDADGQHQAAEIPRLIEPILKGEANVVFGSRFLKSDDFTPFLKKWLILKPAILFQNLLLGVKLTDAHNGFRALSRKALELIRITQDGMAHASEIVEKVKLNGLKYREVPVTVLYNDFGQGFGGGLKILADWLFGKFNNP
ncbi:MAG: hypothetical protein A2927_00145 [Candidatus Komeilibacteria bacterium RIFCSPLOWO2_01_FULL_45_10]|uniref:Glycosyltransferase 2-like domain-containing protein n=1 Tax=Candidatus Komeilibacteria bacterium RIFCSPLOWO2_01_FULL_45_10 TaxID=1798550 RepID=A0A1G2BKG9_9BACT|nr:MAG: hypothetical protein A2927_00145 [Candidatus Komeilibacteria bacterium RIFCSPLOWO2_01_FULL_45_10]